MKNRFVYVAAVALMASSLVLAQSSTTSQDTQDTQSGSSVTTAPQTGGDNMSNENQSPCVTSQADQNGKMPGSMAASADQTPGMNRMGMTDNSDRDHFYSDYDAAGRADAGGGR